MQREVAKFSRIELLVDQARLWIPAQAIKRVAGIGQVVEVPGSTSWLIGYAAMAQGYGPLLDLSRLYTGTASEVRQWVELDPMHGWPAWGLAVRGVRMLNLDYTPKSRVTSHVLCRRCYEVSGEKIDEIDVTALQQIPEVRRASFIG